MVRLGSGGGVGVLVLKGGPALGIPVAGRGGPGSMGSRALWGRVMGADRPRVGGVVNPGPAVSDCGPMKRPELEMGPWGIWMNVRAVGHGGPRRPSRN